jgi:hypothetical protein
VNIIARTGFCLITPDPPDAYAARGIFAPGNLQRLPKTGLCLLHSPSGWWDEAALGGKRVVFDRAGSRLFKIKDKEGRLYEIACVHERGILAVFEETVQ